VEVREHLLQRREQADHLRGPLRRIRLVLLRNYGTTSEKKTPGGGDQEIIVVKKPEHQLPLAVVTFLNPFTPPRSSA
jgi:hypothetical protein